jgi:hypothetical protein
MTQTSCLSAADLQVLLDHNAKPHESAFLSLLDVLQVLRSPNKWWMFTCPLVGRAKLTNGMPTEWWVHVFYVAAVDATAAALNAVSALL